MHRNFIRRHSLKATRCGRYLSLDNLGVRTTYLDASECTEVERRFAKDRGHHHHSFGGLTPLHFQLPWKLYTYHGSSNTRIGSDDLQLPYE